jgi:hypothetical protein
MTGRNPGHFGESLSPRGKWVLGVIGVVLVTVLAGVGVWSVVGKNSYASSRNGCVNVNVVSSMGGALSHSCGAKARAVCKSAFRHNDALSRQTRTQCRLAGLAPANQP